MIIQYGGRGPLILGICWTMFAINTVLLISRTIVKFWIAPKTRLAALLWTYLSWALGTVAIGLQTGAVIGGMGSHIDGLARESMQDTIRLQWLALPMTNLAAGIGRIAIVSFILEISGPTDRRWRIFLWFLAYSNLVLNIVLFFLFLFSCFPSRAIWDWAYEAASCAVWDNWAYFYFGLPTGAWNAATDLFLTIYPTALFANLHMSLRRRLGLCALMSGGLFATGCSIAKTVHFATFLESPSADFSWTIAPLVLWTIVEMWAILIAASIPPAFPLARFGFRRVLPSDKEGSSGADSNILDFVTAVEYDTEMELEEVQSGKK